MRDVLEKPLQVATGKLHAAYVEARAQKLNKTMLTVKEDRVEAAKEGIENGVALRVLVKGAWGFATVGSFDSVILENAVTDACKMASAASSKVKNPISLAETKAIRDRAVSTPKKDPSKVAVDQKIRDCLSLSRAVMSHDSHMKGCTIDYLDVTGTDYFMNGDGTYIEKDKLCVWCRVVGTAQESSVLTSSREEMGSTAGYELFDTETPESMGAIVAKRAIGQLKAKSPQAGSFPVVLSPNVMGVFVHEAFGHLAEADLTLSGSVLMDKLGKKVGSDVVTIYDDGTVNGAFGSFKYDDEGVPSQKTILVREGVVVGLMHNRETAKKLNAQPTGNARAEDFRVEPIIRMRNTFIDPRDRTFEELLEGVKSGYYFKSFRGGQANLDGTFQVGIQEGYEIIKGEIGSPVRNASISGNTLEALHNVEAVGKDFELSPGRCGKDQTAFVCDGGAHVKLKEVLVGGTA